MKKFFAIFFAMMCMTLTSFAGDLLTAAMFHSWSSSGAGAVDNGATGCNYKINDQSASDGLPYGDGNVYYLNYADLTAYSTMEIEFTEGTPRLLFNRDGDNGPLNPEINGSAGMDYVTVGEGIWTIDLAAITKAFGYAHLNCIKGANWANATITRVELFKAAAPVNPNNMLTGDAFNFEGGTTGGWGAWGELAGDNGVVSPGFESDYCFKAVTTGTGDNWKAQAGFTFPAALDQSTEYTLKFMAKGSGTVQMFYQSSDYANQDYKSTFTLTDEWQEFTEKYTPGFDNIVRILFSFGQCTELYVDNIEFVPASAPAPAPTFVVDSYVGSSYEGINNAVSDEFAAVMVEALGLTGADGEMIEIGAIMPDGTVDWAANGKGEYTNDKGELATYDGWRNAEGNWCAWGVDGFTFYSQPYVELEDGKWYFGSVMGSAPGAVTEPTSFTTAFVFKANGKECTVTFTVNYIERPELKVEVQEEVDVPAFTYDFTLGYAGAEGTFDISMVEDAIGCTAAEAEVFGFNPSTEEAVRGAMATFDGWHAANGDLQGWGEAPFCIKFYNNGTFWYCAMPDVAELGATYKTSWLLVNPETGDAIQYNFTMNDVERGSLFEEGEYYLYNAEADAWLGGGNSWGTHATLIKHGMPVYIGECQNGNVYTINTYTYNNANDHYLGWDAGGSGFFVDAYSQGLTFTKAGNNEYYISANGSYIGTTADAAAFAGSPVDLMPTTDVAQAARWTLVSRADREAVVENATPDSPADATFLIQVPNFSRNQAYTAQGQSPWTKEAANCNISGGDNTNNNAESWRSSNGFNVYQTLTNLPTGVYRIDVQGAVCEYANPKNGKDLAVAYANDATTPFVVSELADRQAGNENSMSEMSASFTAGKYQLEPMYVTVTDGTLTVGVKSPRTDTWAVWDNFELTYYGKDYIPTGEYYLYNAEADAWLAGGNSWGTQASLNKHGMPVYISYEGNNAYSIDTYTYNSDVQHFLGSNLYVDADKTNWTVERVGEGVNNWAFSVDGNYVGYDGSSDILANLTDKNAAGACWTLVTRAERQATLAEATIDNPVDATFYIEVPNFSRNQAFTARNQSPWTAVGANVEDAAGNKNLSGGNNTNNNAESWRSSNGFNVYQTLTNLPSGVYELRAQAAVCDYAGTFVDLAYVYANDKKSAFNSSSRWAEGVQENGENSMSAMSESFTAGKYAVKPIHILVTDGQIELGVYSPRTDTWAVWDNFELYYLGQDAEVNHEDPKYTMVATDNVVIEYHATAPQASQAIDATNYLATLGAASAEETQLYAVDTNAGLTLDPLSWVNFTGYFNAEGCVSGLVDAAVKANVDLAGKQVTVEALAETVEPRYHAYAVLACEKTAKAILIAIEVNFVDRPDYAEFTAINNVKADGADAKIFDLSGREVKKATKGVYIINGVKTFVK